MSSGIVPESTEARPVELLPWHRPAVQRLVVNLDTGGGANSNIDLLGGDNTHLSDRRLKKDVSRIKEALNGILSLRGVTYHYNTTEYPELGLSHAAQIGFIAQELEQVYPQLVSVGKDGYRRVNYAQLVPVLVEAIKEQQSMIADLQEQVNLLQEKSAVGRL